MPLPKRYAWLNDEPGPIMLKIALGLYGTAEVPGPGDNPSILEWAKQTGLDKIYKDDATAWCGLFMAYVSLQARWPLPVNPLGARNWLTWGVKAPKPMLGDVLVFWRNNIKGFQGHVGIYVGQDETHYHVLGGNQADTVSIKRIAKGRLLQARRPKWLIAQPKNVRVVHLEATGPVTSNEA